MMMRLGVSLLSTLLAVPGMVRASLQIIPGGTWTADNGKHMQAHGAGMILVNNTYFLIGEDKTSGSAFQNINCYSSQDLVRWSYEGALLSRGDGGVTELGSNRVVERPKVIYNEQTGKYVLWMHIDSSNYGEAKVGVATGDSVCGKYTFLRSFRPLNRESRDMGLFVDSDKTAYLLTEDRAATTTSGGGGLHIMKLSPSYTDVDSLTYTWPDRIESPAMVKHDGRYFMFGSHLTGWDPNDNVVSSSASLYSGWSSWAKFADSGSNTYSSQTNYILPYDGGIMYMGDRWLKDDLASSTYVWLPVTISGSSVSVKNKVSWVPNAGTGMAWSDPPAEKSIEGETAQLSGNARTVSCSQCSGGTAAGYLGGTSEQGSVTFPNVPCEVGGLTTVRMKYMNGNSSPRYAKVKVKAGSAAEQVQTIAFLHNGASPASSSLNVQLAAGSDNTIVVEGVNNGWAPDIDRLMVPQK